MCEFVVDFECQSAWVNVNNRLPNEGEDVLIYIPTTKKIELAWLDDGLNGERCFVSNNFGYALNDVEKWFPVPKAENMILFSDYFGSFGNIKDFLVEYSNPVLIYSHDKNYAIATLNKISDEYYFIGDDINLEFDEVEKFNFLPPIEK